jgi:hypothetical protein
MTGKYRGSLRGQVFSGVVAVVALFSIVLASSQVGPTISLYDAIRDGKVNVTMRGTGGSSGPSVLVDASKGPNAGPGDVHVTVPPGTILRNRNGGGQNMVVAGVLGRFIGSLGNSMNVSPGSEIVVSSATPVTYVLEAYCVQFTKHNPSSSDQFTLAPSDPTLSTILAQAGGLSTDAIQAAVWMYTDHVTYAQMYPTFPINQADWAAAETVRNRTLAVEPARPPVNQVVPVRGSSFVANDNTGVAPPTEREYVFALWHYRLASSDLGTLRVSPGHLTWVETAPRAKAGDNFSVSCSEILYVYFSSLDPPGETVRTRTRMYTLTNAVKEQEAKGGRILGLEEAISWACPGLVKK